MFMFAKLVNHFTTWKNIFTEWLEQVEKDSQKLSNAGNKTSSLSSPVVQAPTCTFSNLPSQASDLCLGVSTDLKDFHSSVR